MDQAGSNDKVSRWLADMDAALLRGDARAAAGLFGEDAFWRDLIAFTWNLKTMEGRTAIEAMLESSLASTRPTAWRLLGDASTREGVTEAWILFETASGHGRGHLRLREGRCWTLLTTLQSLTGFEEKTGANDSRELGVEHGIVRHRSSWLERKMKEEAELGYLRQPYCLIVGGGQGGLALAARLKRLDVPTIVVDKHEKPGDQWRKRYRSLCLHDPVWYDHMPYVPFPDHWPVFSPKDKIGDWLEMYAKVMEIDYWGSTECLGAHYDETDGVWDVTVDRAGDEVHLRPTHLILATGMSGVPNVPDIPGADTFSGTLCHSSTHTGSEEYAGKRCVIIGSNNSAHDICADLWEWGADVTMIQRSPSIVVRSESLMEHAWGPLYSEAAVKAGITTDIADLRVASVPLKLMPEWQRPVYDTIRKQDAAFYEALEAAGFRFHFGEDGSGIHTAYLRRGAGYYIDVGASQLIIDGEITLESAIAVERINQRSLTLENGKEIPADLIVCATGYGPMNDWAAKLISEEVAHRVGRCWGVGSDTRHDPGPWEGELRNMWKPTHQPALWFQGGNLMQARHYSRYLALQLKARQEGMATPVYGIPPVHHRE